MKSFIAITLTILGLDYFFHTFGIHFSFINALVVSLEISIVASVVEAVIGD